MKGRFTAMNVPFKPIDDLFEPTIRKDPEQTERTELKLNTLVEFVPKLELVSDEKLKKVLENLNKGIHNELNGTDLLVGHSFFMNKTADDI